MEVEEEVLLVAQGLARQEAKGRGEARLRRLRQVQQLGKRNPQTLPWQMQLMLQRVQLRMEVPLRLLLPLRFPRSGAKLPMQTIVMRRRVQARLPQLRWQRT